LPEVTDFRTWGLALADVDGDRDLDMIQGAYSYGAPPGVRVYANLHRHLDVPLVARLGYPCRFDVYAKPGFSPGYHVAFLHVGATENRTPLPPLGTFWLDFATLASAPPMMIPQPGGKVSFTLTVPMDHALVGKPFFAQALVVDSGLAWPHLTNVVGDRVFRL
jgi:hypothetical protein